MIAIGVIGLACVADEVYAQMRLRQLMIDKLQTSQKLLEAVPSPSCAVYAVFWPQFLPDAF